MSYTILYDDATGRARLRRDSDGAIIPKDDRNKDRREFLEWNATQDPPLDDGDRPPPPAPPPLKPAATLQEAFLAAPAEQRQALWDEVVGQMMLRFAESHPDVVQEAVRKVGADFELREKAGINNIQIRGGG